MLDLVVPIIVIIFAALVVAKVWPATIDDEPPARPYDQELDG